MVELYLLTFPRFPLRKKEHKSYFGKNRTHDFRTSRCAAIQIATNSLPGSTTLRRQHRKLIGAKTMSLGTKCNFYCCIWSCQYYFRILVTSYREDCLVCCPYNKVIKSDPKTCLALGGLHEDTLCHTLQAMTPTNQCQNGSSNFLTPYREQPQSIGLLSPTYGWRVQQQSIQIVLRSVFFTSKPKFLRPHVMQKYGKSKYRGDGGGGP